MKKIISIVLTIALVLSTLSAFAFAADSTSTPVSTKQEFLAMTAGGTYHLTADIDLGTLDDGYAIASFTGTLDGGGYTVSYKVTAPGQYTGLIKSLGGTVKNLTVNADISGTFPSERSVYAGAIVARTTAPAIIDSCTVKGTATYTLPELYQNNYIGGIAGYAYSSIIKDTVISNCKNAADVTVNDSVTFNEASVFIGGITGAAGNVDYCVNTGKITSNARGYAFVYIAGIAATETSRLDIEKCSNYGDVYAEAAMQANAAGILASAGRTSQSIVSQSQNFGSVHAENFGFEEERDEINSTDSSIFYAAAGGVIAEANQFTTIANISNHGEISAITPSTPEAFADKSYAAGIAARVYTDITKAYDGHKNTISATYTGPIYAAINMSTVTAGNISDSYYVKEEDYNTVEGEGSGSYSVTTQYLNPLEASLTTSYAGFSFGSIWLLDAELGYPVIVTAAKDEVLPEILEGWQFIADKWYFYENGEPVKNTWKKDSTGWCHLGEDGAMETNKWVMDSIGWCYVGSNGYCVTNCWMKDSHGWCYLDSEGSMVKNNWVLDSGKWYFLDEEGYMVSNGWRKDSRGWCYLGADGAMATNKWVKDSQGWCYVGSDGYCVTNCWMKDSTGWCYLDSDGRMATNKWVKDSQGWCYVGSDGYCVTNTWKKDSHGWCYLGADGRMVTSAFVKDSHGYCWLDANGYWDGTYA